MFDLEVYKEILKENEVALCEYYSDHLIYQALSCDIEAQQAAAALKQWKKKNLNQMPNFFHKLDTWTDANIDLEAYLETLYYQFGRYCKLHDIPVEKIQLFPYEVLCKVPSFSAYEQALKEQRKAIKMESDKEQALIDAYIQMEKSYESTLLLALGRLGYYHCKTEQENMDHMEPLFKSAIE